jgi:hypothetical protein
MAVGGFLFVSLVRSDLLCKYSSDLPVWLEQGQGLLLEWLAGLSLVLLGPRILCVAYEM